MQHGNDDNYCMINYFKNPTLSLHHCSHMRKGVSRVVLFLNSPPHQEVNYDVMDEAYFKKKCFSGMVPALFSAMNHITLYIKIKQE